MGGTYDKSNKNINDLSRKENIEILVSYLLSNLVTTNKTKHILLSINNVDVKMTQISDIINKFPSLKKLKEKVENGKISEDFYIHVKEHFFKSISLKQFISENKCDSKSLLFQIIHTLITIQNKYPNFRHNELSVNNILLYLKKSNNKTTKYIVNDTTYYLPNKGFDIKIKNFLNSSIEGLVFNSDISADQNKKDSLYDIKFFIKDLEKHVDINQCDENFKKFINFVKDFNGKSLVELIENDFFKEYLNDSISVTEDEDKDEELNKTEDEQIQGYPFKVFMKDSDIEKLSDVRTIDGQVIYENKNKENNNDIHSSVTSNLQSLTISSVKGIREIKKDNDSEAVTSIISTGGYSKKQKKYKGSRTINSINRKNKSKNVVKEVKPK